ncbi:hypothetical protein HK100_011313 [Physocladia obscura]|uniref:Peptidase M20 domain-containing protein 2 n=1 Tax=Physocladia obscura TaxID=109957 RepID=A0AAD5T207_9FUNG|nr:hypothetical protein HK100_011313 [Physocladia obscura]
MAQSIDIVGTALAQDTRALRELSLALHENPELSGAEHNAHALLADFLESREFSLTREAAGMSTAFVAEWGSPSASSDAVTVAFVSEFDALPAIGHACGHNLIAITGVAAALSLQAFIKATDADARIKLFGTPAEETWGGKINFIEQGFFTDVDVAMMTHPGNVNVTWAKYLALSALVVDYHGKSAHAASNPWDGANALDALVQAYNSTSMLRQQVLPTTRIHGIIKKGGDAPNIIPQHTQAEFMLRTEKLSDLNALRPKINSIFEAAALATGTTAKVKYDPVFEDVVINSNLAKRFEAYARDSGCVFPSEEKQKSKSYGSTDMGNITHVVPGIHPIFDIESTSSDIHTDDFREGAATAVAHDAAVRAAKCLALTAIDFITDAEFRNAVRAEFEATSQEF